MNFYLYLELHSPELNAVLKQYDVFVQRETKTVPEQGLLYRILDADGKPQSGALPLEKERKRK